MPLNCFDATFRSFEQQVLPELERRGIAAIGHEEPGRRRPAGPEAASVSAEEALRYAMSLPVATTVSGIDSLAVLRQNLSDRARLQADERRGDGARSAALRRSPADGHFELYKTTEEVRRRRRPRAARLSAAGTAPALS